MRGVTTRGLPLPAALRVLGHVILKEFLQLRRDRRMIPMLVIAPLIQIVIFGFAANLDVNDVPLLVVDRDRTAASRELTDRFLSSGRFVLVGTEDEPEAVEGWLVRGRAQIALVVAEHYGEDIAAGRAPRVQIIADGSDSTSAVVGLSYASRIVTAVGAELAAARTGARAELEVRRPRVELVPRVWYNPDLKTRWFYVPAILAMVVLMATMVLPSMAVVREKEIGTLEQLIVTPVTSWQLIAGKLAPFAVIGMLDVTLITGVVVWFFGLPFVGSFPLLFLFSIPFVLTMLGAGLLVSTLARNQQQAMMASTYLVMVPMIYLSGLMFPIESMPRVLQVATYGIPLRYYANIIRGIILRGSGFGVLWPDALALTGFGLGLLVLASLRFRKTLD